MPLSSTLPPDPTVDALREAERRAARGGAPRSVLLLHLTRLAGIEPYHARVARAVMADAAQRLEGEVLRLAGGDLVLVCQHVPDFARGPDDAGPDGLPCVLRRLFSRFLPADGHLFTLLHLPEDAAAFLALLNAMPGRAPAAQAGPGQDPLAVAGVLLEHADIEGLLRRHLVLRLAATGSALAVRPVARMIGLHLPALHERMAAFGVHQPDPMVVRHLAGRLDLRWLALAGAGRLAGLAPPPPPQGALHLRLSLQAAADAAAGAVLTRLREAVPDLLVELTVAEMVGAPDLADAARAMLTRHGIGLSVGGISAEMLTLCDPGALPMLTEAALLRLDWSAGWARLAGAARARAEAAIGALRPARLVLTRADTELALAWGLKHGIGLFEGRQVGALTAAARLRACAHAAGCSLDQCMGRAATLSAGERAMCRNHALLDRGMPSLAVTP